MRIFHKGTAPLATPHLTLRSFRSEDAGDIFHSFASDPLVTRYLNWVTHSCLNETEQILKYWIDEYGSDMVYNWAICNDDHVIGMLTAVEMSEKNGFVQIAYCLARQYWGQGLVTEAVECVLRFFLKDCGFHRVYARCVKENVASSRVLEKCGLKKEGTLRNHLLLEDGTWHDVNIYGILREEIL